MKHITHFKDFLKEEVNLNQTRLDKLADHVEAVVSYLKSDLDGFLGMERQGSYGLMTIIKPHDGKEYDADMLLFVDEDQHEEAAAYINAVYDCLRRNSIYKDKVSRRTRCVVIDYADDCHLDIVPCTERDGSKFVCNRNTNCFEPTDGTGYRDWFNDRNRNTDGNLRKAVRLFKFLRDHKQNFSVKSILLTTLVGRAEEESWRGGGTMDSVPDALNTVAVRINAFLQEHASMPTIENPVLRSEDFNRHWDQKKYENFRSKFDLYAKKIGAAFECEDHDESVKKWREVFGDTFGQLKTPTGGPSSGGGAKRTAGVVAPTVFIPPKQYARRTVVGSDTEGGRHSAGADHDAPRHFMITDRGLGDLRHSYPSLRLLEEEIVVEEEIVGDLLFAAHFDRATGSTIVWPEIGVESAPGSDLIRDTYSVRIVFDRGNDYAVGLPTVYETGDRVAKISADLGINGADLHVFNNGSLCLGIEKAVQHRRSLVDFVTRMVVPFFYRLSYVERHGLDAARRDLWAEYAHGDAGPTEYDREIRDIAMQRPGRNEPCPCGSGEKYKRCCREKVLEFQRRTRLRGSN